MNLKQTRLALGLSLRDAAALVGVSHQQIKKVESGTAAKVAIEHVRTAYRKHARKHSQLSLPEKDVLALKSLSKKKQKFEPLTLSVTFFEKDGSIHIRYSGTDERTHDVGNAVCEALASVSGCTADLVRKF